jgi:hypothetical protein
MSIDQFPISTLNRRPIKAFCSEGRSCVIDSATLHELIDRKAQRYQVHVRGQRILAIAGNVLRGSAASAVFPAWDLPE